MVNVRRVRIPDETKVRRDELAIALRRAAPDEVAERFTIAVETAISYLHQKVPQGPIESFLRDMSAELITAAQGMAPDAKSKLLKTANDISLLADRIEEVESGLEVLVGSRKQPNRPSEQSREAARLAIIRFGGMLRGIREEKGIGVEQLARELGYGNGHMAAIESGRDGMPPSKLKKLFESDLVGLTAKQKEELMVLQRQTEFKYM
ncbi:MAG: helix-turn-helix transcriptional regulator [Candidatus Micrarchaeota archaeon]|nr:helix-turn-helix transcriptional regulator [Candidatus Micrarchaeota archaeon]